MSEYEKKIETFLIKQIKDIKKPIILELGVKEGRSTKMFLEICKKNDGKLFSIDRDEYSNLFNSPNWNFIKSNDDDFDYLKNKLPEKFDIIYLDTTHEADHVEKIFYSYFKKLKLHGFFFIDDISWLPYLKTASRNNFYCEINNKETFERLLSIYQENTENFDIEFSFLSSGICKIIKKKNELNIKKKIVTREISIKNILKKILAKFKK
tara:strand:- start:152 stop:778 length:627 start_codon:yes stop_codon:yes gene_type:complete